METKHQFIDGCINIVSDRWVDRDRDRLGLLVMRQKGPGLDDPEEQKHHPIVQVEIFYFRIGECTV